MTSTHPKSESALLLAMANAQTTDEQRQIAAELETVRRAKRTQDEADRMSSLSLAALAFPDSDTERHTSTASSDWLADIEVPQVDRTEMENQMRAQATVWLQGRPAEVRADGEEFRTQAASKAHYLSNHFPGHREAAAEAFLDQIRTLAVEDWARADDDAVSVSDADQHEKVEFEGATADEEAETSASDSPSLAEGTEPEGDTPMDDSDPAWQGKNHDDSTFNREDAGQTVARRKTAASTHSLSVGDRVMLTQDGKEREFEVTSVSPSGSTGRAESAGPRVTVTLVGGKGYSVSFDDHSQPGISSWSKVSARMAGRRKTAAKIKCQKTDCDNNATYRGNGSTLADPKPRQDAKENFYCDEHAPQGGVRSKDGFEKSSSRKTAGLTFRGEEYYVGAVGRNGSPKTAQNCQNCGREVFNQEAYVTAWSDGATQKVLCRPCGDDVERGVTASRKTAAWTPTPTMMKSLTVSPPHRARAITTEIARAVQSVGPDDVLELTVNGVKFIVTMYSTTATTDYGNPDSSGRQSGDFTVYHPNGQSGEYYFGPSDPGGRAAAEDAAESIARKADMLSRSASRKSRRQAFKVKEMEDRAYDATCPNPDCENNGVSFVRDDLFSGDDDEAECPDCDTPLVWQNTSKEGSRKTAVSLSNVGVESDTVGTGTDPSGKKVRFSITPAEAKQLKDILFSDMAINFSGVDVEESDIIKEGAGPRRQAALTPVSELTPGDVIDPWGDGPWRVMNMKPGEFHSGMDVALRLNDGREITYPFDSTEKVKKVATRTATEGRKAASRAGDDFSWAFGKEKASSRRKKVSNRRVAHNGWTNWDTWNAALWINNEEGIYRAALGTESPEALRALVEDFGLTGDGFDSDKVNWEEVWTDSEFGPNHQGSRRTAAEGQTCSVCGDKIAKDPEGGGYHHDNGEKHDHEAKPSGEAKEGSRRKVTASGEKVMDFDPNSSPLNARQAEGHENRMGHPLKGYYVATADEGILKLVRTCCGENKEAGGRTPFGRSPRQVQAAVGDVCWSCGGKGYYRTPMEDQWGGYDSGQMMEVTCSTCGGSGVVNEPDEYPLADDPIFTGSRKVAFSWIYSLIQIAESGQDGEVDGLPVGVELAKGIISATRTEGGRALLDRPFHEVYDMAVKSFAGAVFSSRRESSRRNHPSAGVDFSWAFANSKNSRKVQK